MATVTFIFQVNTTKAFVKVNAVTMRQALHKAAMQAKVKEVNLVFIRIISDRAA